MSIPLSIATYTVAPSLRARLHTYDYSWLHTGVSRPTRPGSHPLSALRCSCRCCCRCCHLPGL